MRLKPEIRDYFKSTIVQYSLDGKVYLFGSRTDDSKKGGDIDILYLSKVPIPADIIRNIRITFYKKFGFQKIDLINYTFEDNTIFKSIITNELIEF